MPIVGDARKLPRVGSRLSASTAVIESFIFTWKTDNAGTSASDAALLPIAGSGPYDVDWGDTNVDSGVNTHTYASSGTYTITITDTGGSGIQGFRFAGAGDRLKILEITNWGLFDFNNSRCFQNCNNLIVSASDTPTLSSSIAGASMFQNCNLGNVNLGRWNWSVVTNMSNMLIDNANFSGEMTSVVHASVTTIRNMMTNCVVFDRDISTWMPSGVTDASDCLRATGMTSSSVAGWTLKGNWSGAFNASTGFLGTGVSSWNIVNWTNAANLFFGSTFSTATFDAILIAFEAQAPANSFAIHFGSSTYTLGGAAEAARTSLVGTYGWTISDGGGV